jgi:hypothetical protein
MHAFDFDFDLAKLFFSLLNDLLIFIFLSFFVASILFLFSFSQYGYYSFTKEVSLLFFSFSHMALVLESHA